MDCHPCLTRIVKKIDVDPEGNKPADQHQGDQSQATGTADVAAQAGVADAEAAMEAALGAQPEPSTALSQNVPSLPAAGAQVVENPAVRGHAPVVTTRYLFKRQ